MGMSASTAPPSNLDYKKNADAFIHYLKQIKKLLLDAGWGRLAIGIFSQGRANLTAFVSLRSIRAIQIMLYGPLLKSTAISTRK